MSCLPLRWLGWAVWVAVCGWGCGFRPALDGPPAGNPAGTCPIPTEAQAVDTTRPDHVIGTGTPEGCTSDAVVRAVAAGGIVVFDCGPEPITITLEQTAKLTYGSPRVVLDGGDKVALSGGGKVRILYADTCATGENRRPDFCMGKAQPELVVQNLTLVDGIALEGIQGKDIYGGGAIFLSGGVLKVSRCRFFRNVNPDISQRMGGGGAIRTLYTRPGTPTYIVSSTFGGEDGLGNQALDGGALAGFYASFAIINSRFTDNQAGVDGYKGAGGAILAWAAAPLALCGVDMRNNRAGGQGGAVWFSEGSYGPDSVLRIEDSTLHDNEDTGHDPAYPGIKALGPVLVTNSSIR